MKASAQAVQGLSTMTSIPFARVLIYSACFTSSWDDVHLRFYIGVKRASDQLAIASPVGLQLPYRSDELRHPRAEIDHSAYEGLGFLDTRA
jgi:hypothetical protein